MILYNEIFTEYDDALSLGVDRDPLGFQMIWTHFGQKIFNNKTTSVANDIRNYTINLMHHWVIRSLKGSDFYDHVKKHETSDRAAVEKLVIVLENMLVFACFNRKWQYSQGILGIGNAHVKWKDTKHHIAIDLSKQPKDFSLLVRQISLGVNGRYKSPFIQMGFFGSDYSSSEYTYKHAWDKAIGELSKVDEIKKLHDDLLAFLMSFSKKLLIEIDEKDTWVSSYTNLFNNPDVWQVFARKFWPERLGFVSGAAKALYKMIEQRGCNERLEYDVIFKSTFEMQLEPEDRQMIENICILEPVLSKIDALFFMLLNEQHLDESLFKSDEFKDFLSLPDDGLKRLQILKKVIASDDVAKSLIDYHTTVMSGRGLSPWLKKNEDGSLQIFVKRRTDDLEKLKIRLKSAVKSTQWIHPYYLDSMRSIYCGMINKQA